MPITREVFRAFLKCRTKAYLYSTGAGGSRSEFADWEQRAQEEFGEKAGGN